MSVVVIVVVVVLKLFELLGNGRQHRLAFREHLALVHLDLLLFRHENHAHATTVQARRNLDLREVCQALDDVVHAIVAPGAERHLTAAEILNDLNAVTFDEESSRLRHADVDVVRVDLHRAPETNFLHLGRLRLRLVRLFLLRLFVLELAEVHDLADRRARFGRNLDKVEVGVVGLALRVLKWNNSEHLALRVEESDGGNPDTVVDARPEISVVARATKRSARRVNGSNPLKGL